MSITIDAETDILDIDNKIKNMFKEQYEMLDIHKNRLTELLTTFQNDKISVKIKNNITKSIDELEKIISDIENNTDYNFYVSETCEILEEYKKILKVPLKASFLGKNKVDNNRYNIILQYARIAQKYYPIVIKAPTTKNKLSCNNCSNKTDFIISEDSYICSECGSQQELLQYSMSYKDSDRINITTKYTYDRKVHFRDCINQYQGKQNCTIDQKIYDDLEATFKAHHLLVESDSKEVRFSRITKEHVLMFLKELGYSKHYENVILIHYNMTGKKPDDISHLEDKLLTDFDLLLKTYDKHFKNKVERVNFISTQYVLYQLLQRYKHPCKKEDFVILKTVDRKVFHDSVCEKLFSILGWNHTPLY